MNKKLKLNKKVLSTLDYDAMEKIQGYYCGCLLYASSRFFSSFSFGL
jgi:hypothetical protein